MHYSDTKYLLVCCEYVQCCCRRGKSLSSKILDDQFTSPCPCPRTLSPLDFKSLSLSFDLKSLFLSSDFKSLSLSSSLKSLSTPLDTFCRVSRSTWKTESVWRSGSCCHWCTDCRAVWQRQRSNHETDYWWSLTTSRNTHLCSSPSHAAVDN